MSNRAPQGSSTRPGVLWTDTVMRLGKGERALAALNQSPKAALCRNCGKAWNEHVGTWPCPWWEG